MSGIFAVILCLICQIDAGKTPESENTAFEKGQRYFHQKKFEMAEVMFLEALKADPENDLTYSYLGDLVLAKKRYDEALAYYLKSLELRPESAENNFRIAQTYYYKGNSRKAIEHFLKTYSLDKSMKFALYHAGLTYLMLDRDKENAVKYWEEYISLAEDDPQRANIERVIELLKNPDFTIPPADSGISVEEALKRGIQKDEKQDDIPGDRTIDRYEGLYDKKEL
ncbi:MAG: tetratricopeptide repeat protein [Leptospirales bacterium]|nr:tetratricopeptide repeat protein [Leptospirales bacterium]